jgi:uncharacterized membrane protein YdcZ (DUF606 family)
MVSRVPIMNRRYYGAAAPLNSIHAWEWSGGLVGMAALAGSAALPFILSLPGRGA